MADVKLIVGVEEGSSYEQFHQSIKSIINKLNNKNFEINVKLSNKELKNFREEINNVLQSMKSISSSGTFDAKVFNSMSSSFKSTITAVEKLKASLKGTDANSANYLNTIVKKQAEYQAAYNKLITNTAKGIVTSDEIANVTTLKSELDQLVASIASKATAEANAAAAANKMVMSDAQRMRNLTKISNLIAQCEKAQNSWTAAAHGSTKAQYESYKTFITDLQTLYGLVENNSIGVEEFNETFLELKNGVTQASNAIKAAGKNTQSLGQRFNNLAEKFGTWFSAQQIVMKMVENIKKMVVNVRELDTAMTELKKVTDATETQYDSFLSNATTRAKQLGATLVDTVSASADMARLGYDLDSASALADSALVYKNVGDGISDINEASSSIISTMQAFGVEAENSMQIVDKFNTAGNNFAISSSGVGEALLNSASALAAANNTLDESVGLITAANTVVNFVPRYYGNIAA